MEWAGWMDVHSKRHNDASERGEKVSEPGLRLPRFPKNMLKLSPPLPSPPQRPVKLCLITQLPLASLLSHWVEKKHCQDKPHAEGIKRNSHQWPDLIMKAAFPTISSGLPIGIAGVTCPRDSPCKHHPHQHYNWRSGQANPFCGSGLCHSASCPVSVGIHEPLRRVVAINKKSRSD